MVDGLLVTDGFINRFLRMSCANEVEQLRPDRLTCDKLGGYEGARVFNTSSDGMRCTTPYLDSFSPFSILIMSNQQESPNPIRNTRISAESGVHRPGLKGAFQHVPVLFLEGLSSTLCDLPSQCHGLPGFWIPKVNSGIPAFEQRGVEDVCAGVFYRG